MAKGRKPKSQKAKELGGNAGKRAKAKKASVTVKSHSSANSDKIVSNKATQPSAPSFLCPRGKYAFTDIVKKLHADGQEVKPLYIRPLAMMGEAWGEYCTAAETVQKEGATYITENADGMQMIRERPEVKIKNEARKFFKSMAESFNLIPRDNDGKKEGDELSPLEKIMKERAENRNNAN